MWVRLENQNNYFSLHHGNGTFPCLGCLQCSNITKGDSFTHPRSGKRFPIQVIIPVTPHMSFTSLSALAVSDMLVKLPNISEPAFPNINPQYAVVVPYFLFLPIFWNLNIRFPVETLSPLGLNREYEFSH
ncbi:unnamed protein product [Ranitomeya imitator]|uniref:Uncharacterized protein n=1 Tax=Ranitomeya imitator TaxID=111125 RepID=A0ABN9LUT6_9NEOB|nr:unnamed protein product [Ranitomeya imitator]